MPVIVYKNSTLQRVDKYLSIEYSDFSRRYFQDGLKNGEVLINGEKKLPSYKLKDGDKINIKLSLKKPTEITKLPINKEVELEIVAKYPDFLIINKPSGLIVHPSIFDIRNNSIPSTLAGGLLAHYPSLQNIGEDFIRPGIVHRLDKDTSGLMIIPRTQDAFIEFKKLFKSHKISKTYLALCWNMQKKQILTNSNKLKSYKTINTFIGQSANDHTKQSTAKNSDRVINPKQAATLYKIIELNKLPCLYKVGKIKKQNKSISLVEVKPKTGRKHQVRIHLSSIGLPLVGDHKYTSRLLKNCNRNFPHHLLHAHKLEFIYQGQKYSFTSASPEWSKI